MIKTINVEAQDFVLEEVKRLYSLQKEGLASFLTNYFYLRKSTLRTLVNVFERNELIALVDMFNGTMHNSQISTPDILVVIIEDSETYENISKRHDLNLNKLLDKVKSLSHIQTMILIEEIAGFWNVESNGSNLDDFINRFVTNN